MTEVEFKQLLQEMAKKGCAFGSCVMLTRPKMNVKSRKTGEVNPYAQGLLVKVQKVALMANFDYQKHINTMRQKEGKSADFVADTNRVGKRDGEGKSTLLYNEEKGKYYLMMAVSKFYEPTYLYNGQEVPYEKLEEYLPLKTPNKSQGLEKVVPIISPALESVIEFTYGGTTYLIE